MKNIIFFGDSLTAGYRLADPAKESVPGLIQARIDESGLNCKVHNAGLSGGTSGGGLSRLGPWLKITVDVFVLELGINDLIRKIPVPVIQANLEKIIKAFLLKNPDCKLAIMGMQIPAHFKSSATSGFNEIYRNIASRYQAAYIPFYLEGVAGKRSLNIPDGLHPNAAGYRVIAGNIWPVIKELL